VPNTLRGRADSRRARLGTATSPEAEQFVTRGTAPMEHLGANLNLLGLLRVLIGKRLNNKEF
jgi:hypothetical protein